LFVIDRVAWSIGRSVGLSVGLFVTLTLVTPAKTAALITMLFGLRTWMDGGPDPP